MVTPLIPGCIVRRPLGRGGMGNVYLAIDEATGSRVALKVIGELQPDSPDVRRRFDSEIAAVSRVHHANVVELRSHGRLGGSPYAIFEHVAGVDLSRLAEPLPWQVAAHVAWQLAMAIAAVHDAGLLHRDIKPANVMISRHGWVTLIDFGVATPIDAADDGRRLRRASRSALTHAGAVIGTPRFLAPEVAGGARASVQSDLYGFGLVLAHLLGITVRADRELDGVAPHLPAPLVAMVRRCLAEHPLDRPRSAHEIVAALAALERRPARIDTTRSLHPRACWSTQDCEAPTRRARPLAA